MERDLTRALSILEAENDLLRTSAGYLAVPALQLADALDEEVWPRDYSWTADDAAALDSCLKNSVHNALGGVRAEHGLQIRRSGVGAVPHALVVNPRRGREVSLLLEKVLKLPKDTPVNGHGISKGLSHVDDLIETRLSHDRHGTALKPKVASEEACTGDASAP